MRAGPAQRRRVAAALVAGCTLGAWAGPAAAHGQPVSVAVDASRAAGATNPNLIGFAFDPRIGGPGFQPLPARTFRMDVGFQDLVACPQTSLRPDRLAVLQQKLDAVEAVDAEAILILDYMPPCLADTFPGDPRDPTKLPPRDPAVWQQVVRDLVTATGPGRVAAGRRPVRYYEVWNEPDWVFFEGTQAQFTTNVLLPAGRAVAAVAQASGQDLRFGLCGCLFADGGWMIPLMAAARSADVPVDFLSWHYYGNYPFVGPDGPEPLFPPQSSPVFTVIGQRNPATSPQAYLIQLDQVRLWAQAALGRVPELMVDEWNLSAGGFDKRMDTNEGAAFQAATLAALASDGLDRAVLFSAVDPYDRDIDGNPLPARYGGWGVVDRALIRKPAWYAQWLWSQLGPVRLASPQDATNGVWTAAGKDPGGGRVDVLVASFLATRAHDHTLHVSVAGLHPGRWSVRLFRVDAAHSGATDPAQVVEVTAGPDGRVQLDTALPAQSVVLAELVRPPTVLGTESGGIRTIPFQERRRVLPATGSRPSAWWPLAAVAAGLALQARRRRNSRPAASEAAAATGNRGRPPVAGSGR